MTFGLAVLSATELNPNRFGFATGPRNLNLEFDQTQYVTFVQMPKWSGLEVTMDPTFSAVAAVPQNDEPSGTDTGTTNTEPGPSDTTSEPSGIPGFEFYILIFVAIPLVYQRKFMNKKF